jgi:hypothetical protein
MSFLNNAVETMDLHLPGTGLMCYLFNKVHKIIYACMLY